MELSPEEEAWVYDETPSPCPVCGVGPEQSSDSKRMWTSVCYCGHPRYWDYKVRLQQLREREGQPGPPGVKPDKGTQQGRGAD
ncbi:hypothetical protein [Kibdelosporangium phytohabitans]|uniref:hypothetical protein n=1 Tax=Kibdelosporangium phytohabitans TaxID=860235 RepID=UPI0012FC7BFC|nr:hypothetical protein [Kibdelosporangium phytohabitans]MBE1466112.1 hypothetical protein [Kibdelosporangium phytohabitans]